uniref:Uncharacterized protein n=1 Tax=Globisporangium ultimum (strain ATCC 200006 / CBS 805.95 / DAOM BR144) TaxID=431595 RepID=K3WXX8_GLOUD
MKVPSSISPAKPAQNSKKVRHSTRAIPNLGKSSRVCDASTTSLSTDKKPVCDDLKSDVPPHATPASTVPGQGFAWLVAALRIFYEEKGHFAVPLYYKIPVRLPSAQPWPEKLRGVRLGRELAMFMDVSYEAENEPIVLELFEMGFPLVSDWSQYLWEELTMHCLRIYVKKEGDVNVPPSFIVPYKDEQWPLIAWGYTLGAQLEDIRKSRKRLPSYQIEDLDALGFLWDSVQAKWSGAFLPAFRTFHKLHGHCHVPEAFVVPKGRKQQQWASKLARYPLGKVCQEVRSSDEYAEVLERSADELKELGF